MIADVVDQIGGARIGQRVGRHDIDHGRVAGLVGDGGRDIDHARLRLDLAHDLVEHGLVEPGLILDGDHERRVEAGAKPLGEQIIGEFAKANKHIRCILLRYFNPAGAHPSALIGELPIDKPQNLVPVITQSAIGKLPGITVFGDQYPTRDGSCVRDFIHVCDLAHAHTLALQYLIHNSNTANLEIFNLGTGSGITVLETIHTFEKVTGVKLHYTIGPNRPGDVVAIYANNDKAKKILGWDPVYKLDDIMSTAWKWEQKLKDDEKLFTGKNIGLN